MHEVPLGGSSISQKVWQSLLGIRGIDEGTLLAK